MNEITEFEKNNKYLAQCNINEPMWNALCESIFPGASHQSVFMAVNYCAARNLDIMLKPVHIVPMLIENAQTHKKEWRDVIMPGIGSYRITADRTGNYAGQDEPEFGSVAMLSGKDKFGKAFEVMYPEWCKVTVYKIVQNQLVAFTAKEYWLENYASQKGTTAPNSMWQKRPFAQLAKCAEAQVFRKGFPEVGNEPSYEEMQGKFIEKDITPVQPTPKIQQQEYEAQQVSGSLLDNILNGDNSKPEPQPEPSEAYNKLKVALNDCTDSQSLTDVANAIKSATDQMLLNNKEVYDLREKYAQLNIHFKQQEV